MESIKLRIEDDETLLDRLLKDSVDIAHDCGGKLACSRCRVVVREGLERLDAASEDELDMLDRAGDAAPGARLACQVELRCPNRGGCSKLAVPAGHDPRCDGGRAGAAPALRQPERAPESCGCGERFSV